jgi:hypothetical protein
MNYVIDMMNYNHTWARPVVTMVDGAIDRPHRDVDIAGLLGSYRRSRHGAERRTSDASGKSAATKSACVSLGRHSRQGNNSRDCQEEFAH